MQIYAFDDDGVYQGSLDAPADPLTPGAHLMLHGTTAVAPPSCSEGERPRWTDDEGWVIEPIPEQEAEPAPPPPTHEEAVRRAWAVLMGETFLGGRQSLTSYWLRILTRKPGERSPIEAADLPVLTAIDLWEETVLAERDAAIAEARDPVWPPLPDGAAALIASCC